MLFKVERFFDLRPGDLRRGLPLAIYYFLIIAAYTQGQVVRDALFLGRFDPRELVYVDFCVAAIVGVVLAVYLRIARKISLNHLLAGSLGFFASNVVVFWWFARFRPSQWLFPLLYVWMGLFGVIAIAQVWTLANYALTNREAKRLFGFIGGGGIIGGIFGGLFVTLIMKWFRVESLLVIMAVEMTLAAVVVLAVAAQTRGAAGSLSVKAIGDKRSATLRQSLLLVRSSTHLLTIAALICICSLTTYLAGWQFKALMKQHLVNKEAIADFQGAVYGITGMLAMLFQIFLTPRLLRYFGIRVALLTLPLSFVAGTAAVIATGALWAATLLRGVDRVVRYSIDTAAVQLLYVPAAPETKVQVKSFLDTVVLRAGDGMGAVAVFALTSLPGFNSRQVGWVILAMLFVWIFVARRAGIQYVSTLGNTLRQHRLDAERIQEISGDYSATQMLMMELRSKDPAKIVYILDLLEGRRWKDAYSSIRSFLEHPAPEVRAKAISVLRRLGDLTLVSQIEQLLRDSDLNVRTEALLFLSQLSGIDPLNRIQELGDFPDSSIQAATLAFLARSGEPRNFEAARLILDNMINNHGEPGQRARLEAARLIRLLPDTFAVYLCRLLEDSDPTVLREAARTAGVCRNGQHVSALIRLLGNPDVRDDAAKALMEFGRTIQASLRDNLVNPSVPLPVKREIPDVLIAVAKSEAGFPLLENLRQPDSVLRFRIISALNKLQHLYPGHELDTSTVEAVLAAEIMHHCRSYQIMGQMDAHLEQQSFNLPLQTSIRHELERIFRLLQMLHPRQDLHSAFAGLQSEDKRNHDSALEFIDNTLKPAVRRLVVPLIDPEILLAEKVAFANRVLQSTIESKADALAILMNTEDPWFKSCAAHLIGVLGLKQFQDRIDQWATDTDPALREKAQRAQQRLNNA